MDQLEELLMSAYIPKKSLQNISDELKRAVQRPGEQMREFGQRVEKIMQSCINVAKKEYADNNAALLQIIEKDAIKAFKHGLTNPTIEYHLMAAKRDKLTDIISLAEEIEEEAGSDTTTLVNYVNIRPPIQNNVFYFTGPPKRNDFNANSRNISNNYGNNTGRFIYGQQRRQAPGNSGNYSGPRYGDNAYNNRIPNRQINGDRGQYNRNNGNFTGNGGNF